MSPPTVHFSQALGHPVSDKRLDILRRLGEAGSISQAARSAGVSYRAAWQALQDLSNLAGAQLVEKSVGGSGGGGARLTPAGQQLLEAADLLNQARSSVLATLAKREDNGLSLKNLTGLGIRTSMRNQLPCLIQSISKADGSARVTLVLRQGSMITSRVTTESVELLGLREGMSVLALCKATAVSIGTQLEGQSGLNVLAGEVERKPSARALGEVTVQLMPGLHLIGFSSGGQQFKIRQKVVASFDASAVVIAIPG